ncbi:hypothetical protein OA92_02715 [Marinomonas sp. SBI22]|jgi:hypothetical protein|uniref:hypothetical protein n=1 Tax=unclassified Marinomonas TaxID=196814 RepID=UPI0005FA76B5|nr:MULTISPECIES: hypothetical protein [unclassified Marinomonas]KJZ11063.1 hypothetical protein TW85_18655 [Marinomonas sp. S3726]KZM40727.1 hypothetical protein OA91_18780 [Marinomonas sp. SBI8L]KZM46088.1 hypothetical protein OA92_02715 [Marinomonas sp. SBI22]
MELADQMSKEYAVQLESIEPKNSALASKDILNKEGAVLVKADTELTSARLARIRQHVLEQPLEFSIKMQNSLARNEILQQTLNVINENDLLKELHLKLHNEEDLTDMCGFFTQYPTLVQLITVYAQLYPGKMKKSLTLAWGAWMIARAKQDSQMTKRAVFTACLFQDIGRLFISKGGSNDSILSLTSQVLGKINGLPITIVRSITNMKVFPTSLGLMKKEDMLEVANEDQIVWLSRFLQVGMSDKFSFNVGPLDFIPILKLYSPHYFPRYSKVIIEAICSADLKHVITDEKSLLENLRKILINHVVLNEWLELFEKVEAQLAISSKNLPLRFRQKAEQVLFIVSSTGLLTESLARWMSHVEEMQLLEAAPEVREYFIFQQELARQLSQYVSMAGFLISRINDMEKKKPLLLLHKEFHQLSSRFNYNILDDESLAS